MTPLHHNFLKRMGAPDCRWCGSLCDAEFVDVGVGPWAQVTAGVCDSCGAVQMSPHYTPDGLISEVEMATAWWAPFEDHPDYSPYALHGDLAP